MKLRKLQRHQNPHARVSDLVARRPFDCGSITRKTAQSWWLTEKQDLNLVQLIGADLAALTSCKLNAV